MKLTHTPFLLIAGLVLTSVISPASAAEKGNILSVIKQNDIAAVEELEAWKAEAEGIPSEDPNGTKKAAYNKARRLVDSWIDRKKLEVSRAAGGVLSPKANLGAATITTPMKQANASLYGEPTRGGGGAPAAGDVISKDGGTSAILIGIAKALNDLIKKGKANSADTVNEQLELLRWDAWEAAQ